MKSILVVHQGAIGDLILSLPALEAISRFYPDAGFNFIGHPGILEIIHARPYFRNVLDCSAGNWTSLYDSGARLPAADIDLLLPVDSIFVFGRSSSKIIAENLACNLGKSAYRIDPFPVPDIELTVSEYQCRQLEGLGVPATPPPGPIIAPSQLDVLEVSDFVSRNLESGELLVLLHPGSGGQKKLWAPTGWLRVIRELSVLQNVRFALLQGPADAQIVQLISSQLDTISPILVENWNLGQIGALMRKGSLYLGNDSGITHLAAACGTPTIALFGPSDPLIWGPQGPKVRIVRWQPETVESNRLAEPEKASTQPAEVESLLNQAKKWLRI
jgi:ADP-heptose:LPS heptosyltransferase